MSSSRSGGLATIGNHVVLRHAPVSRTRPSFRRPSTPVARSADNHPPLVPCQRQPTRGRERGCALEGLARVLYCFYSVAGKRRKRRLAGLCDSARRRRFKLADFHVEARKPALLRKGLMGTRRRRCARRAFRT